MESGEEEIKTKFKLYDRVKVESRYYFFGGQKGRVLDIQQSDSFIPTKYLVEFDGSNYPIWFSSTLLEKVDGP